MAARPGPQRGEADPNVPLPLYHQVYVVLRQQIAEGFFARDRPMPGEHELAQSFAVSRITIRRALDKLESDRMVSRRRGSGTFALAPPESAPVRANLRGLLENLLVMGLKTEVRLIEFAYVPASPAVAARLMLPAGAVVQKAIRLRSHRKVPFSHLTTWVPEDIGRSYHQRDLAEKPLLTLLERAGVVVTTAEQTITAKLADTVVAPLLEVEIGTALLAVQRVVHDGKGRPIELIQALYRPDQYEYEMTMSRVPAGDTGSVWAPDRPEAAPRTSRAKR